MIHLRRKKSYNLESLSLPQRNVLRRYFWGVLGCVFHCNRIGKWFLYITTEAVADIFMIHISQSWLELRINLKYCVSLRRNMILSVCSTERDFYKNYFCQVWSKNKPQGIWSNLNKIQSTFHLQFKFNSYIHIRFCIVFFVFCQKDICCSLLLCSWCSVQPRISAGPTSFLSAPNPPAQTSTPLLCWMTQVHLIQALNHLLRKEDKYYIIKHFLPCTFISNFKHTMQG